MQKVFGLLNSQWIVCEDHLKAIEAARSLGYWICIDFIHIYQNPQQVDQLIHQLSSKLDELNCPSVMGFGSCFVEPNRTEPNRFKFSKS